MVDTEGSNLNRKEDDLYVIQPDHTITSSVMKVKKEIRIKDIKKVTRGELNLIFWYNPSKKKVTGPQNSPKIGGISSGEIIKNV